MISYHGFCNELTPSLNASLVLHNTLSGNNPLSNDGGVVGLKGNAGQVNYSASKAGIIGLTNSLAKEVGSRNITVNTVSPGYIETNMTKALNDSNKDTFLAKTSIKRFGTPQDIANIVCFLCSELSEYITGQTINVDGGME